MNKLLTFLTSRLSSPKTTQPTIDTYGQATCGLAQEQIQSVMEWLFLSLLNAGYYGKAHVFWFNDASPKPGLEQEVRRLARIAEPTFLYRCGGRVQEPPAGYYWRLMPEYSSMRVYQLEVREDD